MSWVRSGTERLDTVSKGATMLRAALIISSLVGVLCCVMFGISEYQLSARSSAEPEEIPLRLLIQRGAQGNPNVIITDFEVIEDYIYKSKFGTWKKVWVPVVPADDKASDASKAAIKVFLYGENVDGEAAARQ